MSQMIFYDNPEVAKMTRGETVKYYRTLMGVTQQELADAVNVSVKTIGNVEAGKSKISIDTMLRIANYLKIPVPLLFRGKLYEYFIICLFDGRSKMESAKALSGAKIIQYFSIDEIDEKKAYCMKTEKETFFCFETGVENPKMAVCADMRGYMYVCSYSNGAYIKECDGQVIEISEVVAEVLGDVKNYGVVN